MVQSGEFKLVAHGATVFMDKNSNVSVSTSGNADSVGGPSGNPVNEGTPLIASATVPYPGRLEYGPVCPYPLMRTRINRGLISERTS